MALAGALVHDPRLIILDEPLTGLDAGSARQVKNVLRERVAAGGTVIMTTHILEVAERMADRIGVIADGRLIAEGTLDELRIRPARATTAWKTRSSRWSPNRRRRRERNARTMTHAASLAWLAHHEFRLAWRDWWSMMTAGKPHRVRVVAIAMLAFAAFMHLVAFAIVAQVRRHRPRCRPRHAGGHHRLRAAGLVADDVAGDGIGDARILRALRPRSDPVVAGRARGGCSRCGSPRWRSRPC